MTTTIGDVSSHIFLTRFNLPSRGIESFIRASPGWLEHRVRLFEANCLPAMTAQSRRSFRWLIYFDTASPDWLKARIRAHEAQGLYSPRFCEEEPHDVLIKDVLPLAAPDRPFLVTTCLDNDDALASDFVERLQSEPAPATRTALYFVHGLIKRPGALYQRTDKDNALASMFEPRTRPITAWADWHNRLYRHAEVREIAGAPAWLQIVHGRNVSNRVRGLLTSPAKHRRNFPGLLDDIPEPGFDRLLKDRFVDWPARASFNGFGRFVRQVIDNFGGRGRTDRIRAALARLAGRKSVS